MRTFAEQQGPKVGSRDEATFSLKNISHIDLTDRSKLFKNRFCDYLTLLISDNYQ